MNILILTYQGDLSGATESISFLSKGLVDKGHNIIVGCRKGTILEKRLENTKVLVENIDFKSKVSIKDMKKINEIVKKYKIQIINPQSGKDRYLSIFSRIFFNLKVKIVQTRRQTPSKSSNLFQSYFYNINTDKYIAVSNEVKLAMEKVGLDKNKIEVIYNGTPKYKYENLNLDNPDNIRNKYGINLGEKIILNISRKKRQDQVIKAMRYLPENYKLILVGVSKDTFKQEIEESNLEKRVLALGELSNEEVLNLYQIADIKVLASIKEGLSQALLESMYLKVPVLATNYAGNIDLIKDYENGLLFEDGNINEISEKIQEIINDNQLREKIIKNAEITAKETFSIERTVENYEKFFMKLID